MMQRILAGLSALPGADQAYIISRRDGLVAAVGKRGRAPMVEHATQLVQAMDKLDKVSRFSTWWLADARLRGFVFFELFRRT